MRNGELTVGPVSVLPRRVLGGVDVPPGHEERAVYVVQGDLKMNETEVSEGQLAVVEP